MTSSGRQASQLRFNEEPLWLHLKPIENSVLKEQKPFVGKPTREDPAVRRCVETRRKDVGQQGYATGHGTPTYVSESAYGELPTVEAFFFLKEQYGDSTLPTPKSRFFP
jgi:hypothetical protein